MMKNQVKRYISDEPTVYRVIGLVMVKPQYDNESGMLGIDLDLRMGDIDEPVRFLPFFKFAQRSLNEKCVTN